jgi:PAS domain S-box-containing protein
VVGRGHRPIERRPGRGNTGWLDVVHPDDREAAGAAWGTALATGVPYDVEYRVRARVGGWRYVKARGIPIPGPDGVPQEWVGTLNDVTDRRRAEEAQARLAAIVESSGDAIISKSLDGVIRSWNTGAERLFGYRPEEAVGRHITLIIPPDRHDEERDILGRIHNGERVEHFETVRVTKDGRHIVNVR